MKIEQLNNIRKKSCITIYAKLKKKKILFSRYGKEFSLLNFTNSSGSIELLFYHLNWANKIEKSVLKQKVVRLRLQVKPSKYMQYLFHTKVHVNIYTLIGFK